MQTRISIAVSPIPVCPVIDTLKINWIRGPHSPIRKYVNEPRPPILALLHIACTGRLRSIMASFPRFSRHHPMVPKRYVPQWQLDMKNRDLIIKVRLRYARVVSRKTHATLFSFLFRILKSSGTVLGPGTLVRSFKEEVNNFFSCRVHIA